jgi:hypothetical protein
MEMKDCIDRFIRRNSRNAINETASELITSHGNKLCKNWQHFILMKSGNLLTIGPSSLKTG